MGIASFTCARDMLLRADERSANPNELSQLVVEAFARICDFQWSAVMTVDSDTLLPTGGVVHGFDPQACIPFWDNELLDPDFNKFTSLARSSPPMATLTEAVDGDLQRSPRYVSIYKGLGVADELRVAFTAGRSCVATGVFVRAESRGEFPPGELADARDLVPVAATVLRRALGRVEHATRLEAPVVVMLDGAGAITAITTGGEAVLASLRNPAETDDGALPVHLRAAATRARWSRNSTSLATRMRGNEGQWYRVTVSPISGDATAVALTIEQAGPGDLVPIMLESYGLTQRETDIILALARGGSAKEIASDLSLSAHTVRDHIKSIYDKAGVTGRGELLARLFSEHVLDHFHGSVRHIPAPEPDQPPSTAWV